MNRVLIIYSFVVDKFYGKEYLSALTRLRTWSEFIPTLKKSSSGLIRRLVVDSIVYYRESISVVIFITLI